MLPVEQLSAAFSEADEACLTLTQTLTPTLTPTLTLTRRTRPVAGVWPGCSPS